MTSRKQCTGIGLFKKLEDDIILKPTQNTSTPAESPHATLSWP